MKFKTTKNEVMKWNQKIIAVPYCALQSLLSYEEPTAYTAGVYGWNADVYTFGTVAIVTGYRPFGTVRPGYELVRKYENAARKIRSDAWKDYDEMRDALKSLALEFTLACM